MRLLDIERFLDTVRAAHEYALTAKDDEQRFLALVAMVDYQYAWENCDGLANLSLLCPGQLGVFLEILGGVLKRWALVDGERLAVEVNNSSALAHDLQVRLKNPHVGRTKYRKAVASIAYRGSEVGDVWS